MRAVHLPLLHVRVGCAGLAGNQPRGSVKTKVDVRCVYPSCMRNLRMQELDFGLTEDGDG